MSLAVQRALYGKLAGDGVLTGMLGDPSPGYSQSIYYQDAPGEAEYPLVTFSKQSGIPYESFGDPSAMDEDMWLVKAIDRSRSTVADAAAERIRTLLNDANLSIAGATLAYLRRASDVDYPETVDGVRYTHAGSLFRLVTTD